jgi:hypothetical protein
VAKYNFRRQFEQLPPVYKNRSARVAQTVEFAPLPDLRYLEAMAE